MGDVLIDFDVPGEMRDGTVLRADVFRPTRDGPWPVLLVRSPYGKQDPNIFRILEPLAAVRRGYMVVLQDTRGRSGSDGDWEPLTNERADGHDTVRWAAALPGSNGLVGMYGPSYLGNAQWMAAADGPPELRAIAPGFTWSEPFDGLFGRGGAIELGLSASWSLSQGPDLLARRWKDSPADLHRELTALVSEIDALATRTYWELPSGAFPAFERTGVPDLGYQRALADPEAAAGCRVAGTYDRVDVPVFNVGGWFDVFLQGTLDNHIAMIAAGRPSTLLIGPWSHQGQSGRQGEVNFGVAADEASIDLRTSLGDLRLDWLDRRLKPGRPAAPDGRPVRIFVTGINRWRDEDAWPPARSVDTPMYLREDGGLSFEAPRAGERPDTYRYDPADPVITLGGTLLMSDEFPPGPYDQRRVEERPDVLVYTGEPLDADLEVTGRVRVSLVASSTAPSTDWVARLCDVGVDSVSRNLADGIIRVSGVPGEPAEHEIDLWSIGHVFFEGHRIRVQITSSNFPRWDRNLNTGEPAEAATVMSVADQTVFHDAVRASKIVLPVVPPEDPAR
ncbi:CocE/NonD family hydrolase [Streptosporangium sp. 'caverna']|uniref:CocE/NonD family hydrolase n=1 Tax=Streptosporangium sp. 'caverna' TaxID=2202249 RepID=UPI000D7DAEEB|nr:CocE/NonD family hydrolase [Streptosporangium sp. 'caverna']AWS40663.1 X-Pro dipeptidyl-peptidase [Streptosporangium sp. 'caverna']